MRRDYRGISAIGVNRNSCRFEAIAVIALSEKTESPVRLAGLFWFNENSRGDLIEPFSFRIFPRNLVTSFSSYDVHVIIFIPKFSDQFLIEAVPLMHVQSSMAQSPVQQSVRRVSLRSARRLTRLKIRNSLWERVGWSA